MGLLNTFSFISTHPLNSGQRLRALGRFAWWQVRSRLSGRPVVVPFVGDSRLIVSRGQTGATGNIYTGLHELSEMAFVLHFLRPSDLFVDVGANVGSYTVLAAAAAESSCVAFEPSPAAFGALRANVALNGISSRVDLRQTAVGAEMGKVAFTSGRDTLDHVVGRGDYSLSIQVPMTTLDAALDGLQAALIKIDVEGYEAEVIRGGARIIEQSTLHAVIMETNGSGTRYSADGDALHARMTSAGFVACGYEPFERRLFRLSGPQIGGNTLYIRDIAAATSRVATARRFSIAGRQTL